MPLTALLLLGAALPMALVGNRQAKLLDRDEPRFAQTAREMLQRGDFVVPHLNGAVRFEKPPLSYWAICGAYAVLGPHAFSARLPSALFGAAACLLTYAIGLRLFERRTAFLGAVILLCSLQWVVEAKVATADALLLALLLAALYAAIRLRDGDRPLVWAPVLYVALGLSNLAKGPVGILLVALALGTFLLVTRDRPLLRRLHVLPGLLIVAAVNVPWLVLVQVRTGGAFLETTLEEHFLAHATRGKEGHYAIFLVYVPYLVAFFFPWSILLPGALARAWRERREDRSRGLAWAGASPLFFLCWALSGMLLFSLIGTKLPHYLLPLYPAFALLVARAALCEVDGEHRLLRGRLGMAGGVSMILLSLGVLAGLPLAITGAGFPLVPALVAGVLGLTLTTGVVGAVILMRRRRALPALWALATGAYLSWFGFFHLVLAPLTEYGLSEQVAPALNACRRRGLPVASLGYGEPSLVFLMDGLHILEDRDKLVSLVAREGRLACLITREEYALLKRDPDLAFRSPSFFRGFNFAKWRWVEARLVEVKMRGPPASTRPAPEAPGVPRAGGTVSGRGPTSRR